MEEMERRLHFALATARMAIWDSTVIDGDITAGDVVWSAEGAILLGLGARPLVHSFHEFLRFVHPDDRVSLAGAIQRHVDRCEDYEVEYRILRVDGPVRWLPPGQRARPQPGACVPRVRRRAGPASR